MRIPVFYRPEMSCASNESRSPSAGKPRLSVEDWLSRPEISNRIYVESFAPVTKETLCLAHDPAYVAGVLSCTLPNGFGNKNPEVAESLKYTVGSMVAAAKHALEYRTVAISPTSGFHHAGYSGGGGFCTFNGLMIAALEMKRLGLVKHVLIIDGDAHFGDGTDSYISPSPSKRWINHITASKHYKTSEQFFNRIYLKRLAGFYEEFWKDIGSTLVLYQAGADAWKDDPLGDGIFTMNELRKRDELIFYMAHRYKVPLVVNLAGGYAMDNAGTINPVLAIHRQTINACIGCYADTNGG